MVMKWTCLCLVALAVLDGWCDAQSYSKYQKPQPPPPPPPREPVKQKPQEPTQQKQTFEAPLTWTYPEDPQPEISPEVPFELRDPLPAESVAVACMESVVHVEVKKDMFGTGQLINPSDLLMGSCVANGEDSAAQVLIFEYELHQCGSTLMMTNDALIYSYVLFYNPQPVAGSPVVRTNAATTVAECHYPRRHNVSSLPLEPLWIPFSQIKTAEEFLYFTLKLMTEDGLERPIHQYYLGDMIYIEATVRQFFHVPLRVFVDSCVATASPDLNSNPRYAFIQDHGCLVDAIVTGSGSQFMRRSEENKLMFQLEAFRFHGVESGMVYITCNLRATSTALPLDHENRACSFVNGWQEASGANGACGTCQGAAQGASGSGPGTSGIAANPSGGAAGAIWTGGGGRKVRSLPDRVFEGVVHLAVSVGEERTTA